jgi:hypothetical protein
MYDSRTTADSEVEVIRVRWPQRHQQERGGAEQRD